MFRDHVRVIALTVGALFGATLIAGCGGGSNLPETTRSPNASRTVSVPSVSRTVSTPSVSKPTAENTDTTPATPSKTSTRTASKTPKPSKSEEPTQSESARPTVTATQTVTSAPSETETTPTVSPSATPSPTSATSETASSDSLSWLWLLLAVVVVGGIVWFIVAAARHRRWDAAFAQVLTEARWEADGLASSVLDQSVSGEVLVERWRGSERRLDDMQTELARLTDTAAGAKRTGRIARVSGAATALRQAMAAHVTLRSGTGATAGSEADVTQSRSLVQTRSDALLAAIDDRADPAGPPGTSPPAPPYPST